MNSQKTQRKILSRKEKDHLNQDKVGLLLKVKVTPNAENQIQAPKRDRKVQVNKEQQDYHIIKQDLCKRSHQV